MSRLPADVVLAPLASAVSRLLQLGGTSSARTGRGEVLVRGRALVVEEHLHARLVLPAHLAGVLCRNGSGRIRVGSKRYGHWFDGDGIVSKLTIDGKTQTLKGGDAFYIPPHAMHGAVCTEAGVLIDVFSPIREDFM